MQHRRWLGSTGTAVFNQLQHRGSPWLWLELETVVPHSGGVLDGQTTYRLYMNMLNETDYMSSCSGDADNPLILTSTTGEWYNNAAATTWNAQGLNPVFFTFFPELAFDSFLTIGAEDATTPAAQHPSTVWGAIDATAEFVGAPGNDITVDDATGGAWYTPFPGTVDPDGHVAFAGEDLRVLLAQFTTDGIINGQFRFRSLWKAIKAMNSVTCSPFANPASAEVARMSLLRTQPRGLVR